MEVTHRQCVGKHGCGEMLPLEDFHKDKNGKHGRNSCCKKCRRAYQRKYLKENPEVYAKQKAWEANNSKKVAAAKKAWAEANKELVKSNSARFYKNNPNYIAPHIQAGLDMGIIVYCIRDYDGLGLGHDYVGCTENFPKRTKQHKNGNEARGIPPKLNTDNAEILHECGGDREEGERLEAALHAQGYHGEGMGDNFRVNKYHYDKR